MREHRNGSGFTKSAGFLHAIFTPSADAPTETPKDGKHECPTINITPVERAGRVAVGGAAAVVGLVLLATAGGALVLVLLLPLLLAGLDLVSRAQSGQCPLCAKRAHVPRSLTPNH
jgi:hypothetical protein